MDADQFAQLRDAVLLLADVVRWSLDLGVFAFGYWAVAHSG